MQVQNHQQQQNYFFFSIANDNMSFKIWMVICIIVQIKSWLIYH